MKKISTQVIFFYFFALLPHFLSAQDVFDVKELEEIIIEEDRRSSPLSDQTRNMIVIRSEELLRSPARSVADALNYFAGLDIRRRGVHGIQADAGIRGSTFDQVLILLNGIKLTDPQTGHHNFNLPVDIENIERIEVIKGPSARIYGQNAFAGAINIITKNPVDTFVTLQPSVGENGLWGIKAATSLPQKNFRHYLSYSLEESDGYRYNTDYTLQNVFYQGTVPLQNGQLSILGGFTGRKFGANGFYASPDFMDQYEEIQTSLIAANYKTNVGDRLQLKGRVYWRRNQDMYVFIRNDPSFFRNMHIGNTIGGEVHANYAHKWGSLGTGLDVQRVWLSSNNLGSRQRSVVNFFLDEQISAFQHRLLIAPGINLSHYSDFGTFLFPGIDVGYSLEKYLAAFGNVGYTYRIPTFTNLFYEDPANEGNPDLDAEYAITYELGLKTKGISGILGQLSYFFRDGNRIIDWIKEDSLAKWRPVNLIDVNMQGIDGNIVLSPSQFGSGQYKWIERVDLGYTYISSTTGNQASISRYALENLQHQFTGRISFRYHPRFIQQFSFRYFDRVNLEDYAILNTQLRYESRDLHIFLNISNVANTPFKETNLVRLPGRWISGGFRWMIYPKRNEYR